MVKFILLILLTMGHEPWATSHEPWATSPEPRALSHGSHPVSPEPRLTDHEPRTMSQATAQEPVSELVGVKPTAAHTLLTLSATVNDEQIYFRVLEPKDLEYSANIVTVDGVKTFQFFAAMPTTDVVVAFEVIPDVQLFSPKTTHRIEVLDEKEATTLETYIRSLGLTDAQREQATAAFAQALVSSDGDELIRRAFTNLKPLVNNDWKPFLTWLQKDFESKTWTDQTLKARMQEIADAFAK